MKVNVATLSVSYSSFLLQNLENKITKSIISLSCSVEIDIRITSKVES